MRRILLGVVGVFASALAFSFVAIVLTAASTAGSSWLIERMLLLSGVDAVVSEIGGNLLTGLTVGGIRVRLKTTTVEVQTLEIVPAWGASLVHEELILERLTLKSVDVVDTRTQPASPEPLDIVVAPLPISVDVRMLELGRLVLPGYPSDYVPAVSGGLTFDGNVFSLHDFDIKAAAYRLHGNVSIAPQPDVPVSGTVFWQLTDPAASGRIELVDSLRQLRLVAEVAQPTIATGHARVKLLGEIEPVFDIEVDVPEWDVDEVRTTGLNVSAVGTLTHFDARAHTTIKLGDAMPLTASATASGSLDVLDVTMLSVESTHGRAVATGQIGRVPELLVDLTVSVQDFDPTVLVESLSGSLSGQGKVVWRRSELTLAIESLTGTVNGAPFDASGTLRQNDGKWTTPRMDIRSGPNSAQIVMGWDGERIDGRADLNMPKLGILVPDLRGDLVGTFVVAGSPRKPTVKAQARSRALEFRDWSLTDTLVDIDVTEGTTGHAHVSATRLAGAGATLTGLVLDARGSRTLVDATAGWSFAERRGSVKISARAFDNGWNLSVADGALLTLPGEAWHLDRAITATVAANSWSVAAHCWLREQGKGKVCIDTAVRSGERIQLVGALHDLPAAELNQLSAGLPELAGTVSGRWDLAAEDLRWRGTAALATEGLGVIDRGDENAEVIELPRITLAATLDDNRTTLAMTALRGSDRVVDLKMVIGGFDAAAVLTGHADVRFDDFSALATLSRRVGGVGGALSGAFDFAGTVGSPHISGGVGIHDGRVMLVDPQLELTAVELAIQMTDISQLTVRGAATSKGGHLEIDGALVQPFNAQRHFRAHVEATALPVRIPDADVQLGGQVDVGWQAGLASIKGRVEIPRAEITISALPQGAVAVSSDVIVVDRIQQRAGGARLQVDLELILTDEVHFKAFGLSTNLDGHLRLRQSVDGLVQLNGTVALVNGTFEAYGQTLAIESGRLTYSGPPEIPYVDARATRTVKNLGSTVTVGAHVTGPAGDIKTTLFSDPPMSEAETLAYLVLGRPLSGATAQQSNNVTGAAIALGLKGAAPVIDEIRKVVGIDELTATGGNTEDLALIAGKRLNERVFVRYSYQTFTRTGAVLIQLLLNRRLSLEATAAQAPAIDVIYRVGEYD